MHDYKYTSSVTSMLQELGWKSLEDRRKAIDLTMMYKIVNNEVDIPTSPYIEYNRSSTRAKHTHRLHHIRTSKDTFKFSFFPRTVPTWNSLPATVAEAPSLVSFKKGLSSIVF